VLLPLRGLGGFTRSLLCQNPNSQIGPCTHGMREATGVTAGSKLVSFGRGCKLGGGDSIGDSRSAQASGRVAAGIMGGTEADRIARAGLYGKVSGKSQILIFESDLLFNSHSHCSPFAALN
jgi:hypothetical protein